MIYATAIQSVVRKRMTISHLFMRCLASSSILTAILHPAIYGGFLFALRSRRMTIRRSQPLDCHAQRAEAVA
jgi:hypothetical protein